MNGPDIADFYKVKGPSKIKVHVNRMAYNVLNVASSANASHVTFIAFIVGDF